MEFLQKEKKRCLAFNLCYTLHIGGNFSLEKNFEKVMGTCLFWPGRKIGRNHGPARLGLKIGQIQKLFFLQVFPTLWPIDG